MTQDPTAIEIITDPTTNHMVGYTTHKNLYFDVPYISEITPNLYVGGCENGLILPENILNLVSLYPWESYTVNHDLNSSLTVRMFDAQDQDLEQVVEIARWVNTARKSGPTLVHCQAGLNRSSLVAALALVLNGSSPENAIALIRTKRSPACLCNQAFEDYLRSYDD